MTEFFFNDPIEFQKQLAEKGLEDEIYNAIQQIDIGDTVLTARKILNKSNNMPMIAKVPKDTGASHFCRQLADQCVYEDDYSNAFELYNQALRAAPKDSSDTMLEAYFGRSRLHFKTGTCWPACLADIDKCLEWKHPDYQPKLKHLKSICENKLKATRTRPASQFIDNFFNVAEKHPKVPSVSAAVDFSAENGRFKIIAGKNIPIGSLVALENGYAVHMDEENQVRGCHYCHTFSLNLVPCDSCRHLLFCSEKCKKLCWEEYHNVECHIIHVLEVINTHNVVYPLAVKAAIKLKNLSTWKEFNAISSELGLKQATSCLANEFFDVNNKVSVLRYNNDKHFVYGQTYNTVFVVATIIHYLKSVPSFFPTDVNGRNEAIRAMSRVMVHLSLPHGNILKIPTATKNSTSADISTVQTRNYGLFSFTSKLQNSCNPNLYVVGLNNKIALVSVKPIKRGEELTISYLGYWRDIVPRNKSLEMFTWAEITCQCTICTEKWDPLKSVNAKMNDQQKQLYEKWNKFKCASSLGMVSLEAMYNETLNCLNAFQNTANTKQHKEIFDELKRMFLLLQFETTKNCTYLDAYKNNVLQLK